MEKLLRSKEMDKINELFKSAFDLNSKLVFFPVRHHSPACSYHLKNTIEEYSPEIILIEGPVDGNKVKAVLSDETSEPPFAIYYSYADTQGIIDSAKGKYKCYYPFLDYSPELIALREGKKKGIETEFIDLSYSDILASSSEGKGLLKKEEKSSYNDDYFLEKNKFIDIVCEKEGCRNFNEFWEKAFEICGLSISKEKFVYNLLSYCYFSRMYSTEGELQEEGCLAREAFMADNIKKACASHKKVLVVTGGFHTYGIINLLGEENKLKLSKTPEKDRGVYVMPYSMEAVDRLNGYASGMPFPSFYEEVWLKLVEGAKKPYDEVVLSNIIETGKMSRKEDEGISTFDEICAFDMARGLSRLRGKIEPGAYELIDSITSAFIKGDLNMSTEIPLNILYKRLRGSKIGKLCKEADVPPIIHDFKNAAAKYRLKIDTTIKQEISLEIFSSKSHREISCLMHRMEFLNSNFSRLVKGPSILLRKNLNLVRETWNYKWSTSVDAALIENSVYGGTLKEAAASVIKIKIKDSLKSSSSISKLLVEAFDMGLEEIFSSELQNLKNIISEDGSIYSLVDALYYLNYIYNMKELYSMEAAAEVKDIVVYIYSKICLLLSGTAHVKEEETLKAVDALKELFNIVLNRELKLDAVLLKDALFSLLKVQNINAGVEGATYGILYGLNEIKDEKVAKTVEGYILGTKDKVLLAPAFLNGLFSTARDLIFVEASILKSIDKFINEAQDEDFIRLLPQLRLAFSYFIPREVDEIGEKVAKIYNISKEHFDEIKVISPEILKLGKEIDEYSTEKLREEGIF